MSVLGNFFSRIVIFKATAGAEAIVGNVVFKPQDTKKIQKFLEDNKYKQVNIEKYNWQSLVNEAGRIFDICLNLKGLLADLCASRTFTKVSSLWEGTHKPMTNGGGLLHENTKQQLQKAGIRPRSSMKRTLMKVASFFTLEAIGKSSIMSFDLEQKIRNVSKIINQTELTKEEKLAMFYVVDVCNFWLYNVAHMKVGHFSVWSGDIVDFVNMISSILGVIRNAMLDYIEK